MTLKDERLESILEIVNKNNSVSVEHLQKTLRVSGATIRGYLRELSREGKIRRTHGGVESVGVTETTSEGGLPAFESRFLTRKHEKASIAATCYNLIDDNDCIALDASSTCYYLGQKLVEGKKRLTVVTNGIHLAQLLHFNPMLQVILIGGTIGVQNNTEGTLGVDVLRKLNLRKCMFSGYGISAQNGVTDFSLAEIELKKYLLAVASTNIILVDSSKFGVVSVGSFSDLTNVDMVVTDQGLPSETAAEYQKIGPVLVRSEPLTSSTRFSGHTY